MGYYYDPTVLIILVIVLPIIGGLWVIAVSILLCKKCCFKTQTFGMILSPPAPLPDVSLEMTSLASSSAASAAATTTTPATWTGPVTSPSSIAAATDNAQASGNSAPYGYGATFHGPPPYKAASKASS